MKLKNLSFFIIFCFLSASAKCQIIDSSIVERIDSLLLLCNTNTVQHDLEAAFENINAAEQLTITNFGKHSIYYGNCCHFRGRILNFQGEYESAEKCYVEALEIKKSILGMDNLEYANSLYALSLNYEYLGKYDKAISNMTNVKEIRGKILGNSHPDYIKCIIGLAIENKLLYKYKESEVLYLQALNLTETSSGKKGNNYILILNSLANLYFRMGEFKKSEEMFEELIQIFNNNPEFNRTDYALALMNYAILCDHIGQFEKAESMYLEAKDIQEKVLGKEHPSYSISLNNLATLYYETGQFKRAELMYLEAKSILEKVLGKEHPNYITCLANLANLYTDMAQYEKAELMYLEVLSIRKQELGPEHPDYAVSLNNLSTLYYQIGNYEKAEPLLLEAMAIQEKALGKEHSDYASSITNLANLYTDMAEYEKAKPLYLDGLAINEKLFGMESSEYALNLSNIAALYRNMGQYEKAEPMYLEAKAIQEKVLGKEHPGYATSIINLAILYRKMGQYEKAESLFLEAKAIREKVWGKEHTEYIESLNNLVGLYETQSRYHESMEIMTEAQVLGQSRLASSISFLSEQELSSYANDYMGSASVYSYLFGRPDKMLDALPALGYNQSLFQKGFLMQAAIRLRSLSFDSPEAKAINNKLNNSRYIIAQQLSMPIAERQGLEELEAKANTLEKELARSVAGYAEAIKQVKWKDVQSTLKLDEAAIEFIYVRMNFPKISDSIMYAALVITPSSTQPVFIPLFEERQLKNALAQKGDQHNSEALAQIYTRGLTPQKAGSNQEHLYDLCWKPLDRILAGIKKIYYSPAGMLHQINFDAISTGIGSQGETMTLSNKYTLVQLGSTRSLVVPDPIQINSSNEIVLYGGIQYELDTTLRVKDTIQEENILASSELSFEYALRSAPKRGNNWNYLPGTESEVKEISRIIGRTNFPVQVYRGSLATEESVKQLGKAKSSPRVLHFATHGFFFPNPKNIKHSISDAGEQEVFRMSNHPMMRSGLLLSGSNYAWEIGKPYKDGMEDGILTAYEISQMNLSNTELVVLSACETGLGDIQGNEGVYGLQRAFKIAGVKYLIMSLWSVPDEETKEFMISFYKTWLIKKMSIPEAFRTTQKDMQKRYTNPYLWAGFILVE